MEIFIFFISSEVKPKDRLVFTLRTMQSTTGSCFESHISVKMIPTTWSALYQPSTSMSLLESARHESVCSIRPFPSSETDNSIKIKGLLDLSVLFRSSARILLKVSSSITEDDESR